MYSLKQRVMEIKVRYRAWEADGKRMIACDGPALRIEGMNFVLAGKKIKNMSSEFTYFGFNHIVPLTYDLEKALEVVLEMAKKYYPAELREYVKLIEAPKLTSQRALYA